MKISSILDLSTVDYPNKLSAVIFLPFCNFRCRFCFNRKLLETEGEEKKIDEIIVKIKENSLAEAVVITGGEPCMQAEELEKLIDALKEAEFSVKLDTNGSNPEFLRKILPKIDYIAMDIKASKEKYPELVQKEIDLSKIEESIKLISDTDKYEFRTTVVPQIHNLEEIKKIKDWLLSLTGKSKLRAYFFQNFRTSLSGFGNDLIDEKLELVKPFSLSEMQEMKEAVKDSFDICEIR